MRSIVWTPKVDWDEIPQQTVEEPDVNTPKPTRAAKKSKKPKKQSKKRLPTRR